MIHNASNNRDDRFVYSCKNNRLRHDITGVFQFYLGKKPESIVFHVIVRDDCKTVIAGNLRNKVPFLADVSTT